MPPLQTRQAIARLSPPLDLPENIVSAVNRGRDWSGVRVEVTDFHCEGPVVHALQHTDRSRLSVVLEEVGGRCEPRLTPDRPNPVEHMARHMHFAPAGLETWGHADGVRFVRDMTLSFDASRLAEHLGVRVDEDALSRPRLRFADERIWTMTRMLSEIVDDGDPSTQLYGDGLTMAILGRLSAPRLEDEVKANGLAPWQLRRVVDYLEARLPARVELARLAELADLSTSRFSRAFKISTGMTPYHWQLDARIRRAKDLMIRTDVGLEQIAAATGFADAVHLGRTFRKVVGEAPGAWRRDCRD